MKNPLSANEFKILELIWTEGRALSRPEIIELTPDKDWNPNSIHLILNNMIEKGVLKVDGMKRCGRGYGRTYAASMNRAQYAAELAGRVMGEHFDDGGLSELVRALLERGPVTAQTLDRLQAVLDEKRQSLS